MKYNAKMSIRLNEDELEVFKEKCEAKAHNPNQIVRRLIELYNRELVDLELNRD